MSSISAQYVHGDRRLEVLSGQHSQSAPIELSALCEDVLVHISEDLAAQQALIPLSTTCRRVQDLSLPILFRDVVSKLRRPVHKTGHFLPDKLWSYAHLQLPHICGKCPDMSAGRWAASYARAGFKSELMFAPSPLLCGIYDSALLDNTLRKMPHLQYVNFQLGFGEWHGMPWSVLRVVLSLPRLRVFRLHQ
ncbi:hypothetical protein BD413DRAFT_479665 [Trametes elegans]|nr:hypothetical protein BD413DRAFT_479665 [Trametes elegans]